MPGPRTAPRWSYTARADDERAARQARAAAAAGCGADSPCRRRGVWRAAVKSVVEMVRVFKDSFEDDGFGLF